MSFKEASITATEDAVSGKKYFSVDEANRSLPYVRRVIDDVVDVYGKIVTLRREMERLDDEIDMALERDYEWSMDRLSDLVEELHTVGVELKDFEKGLVDFPAMHDDHEILLCWCKGEGAVSYWHEVDAGAAGRQPVTLLGN